MSEAAIRSWVVSDGRAGIEIQCIGLAEALGLAPEIKRVRAAKPWCWTTPWVHPLPLLTLSRVSDRLRQPWPDLVITCGRQPIAPLIALQRRLSTGGRRRPMLIAIQDPTWVQHRFDLIVAPTHDRLDRPNVIESLGSMHRVTPERLAQEGARWRQRFDGLPRPLVGVLLGGTSRAHQMTVAAAERLGRALAEMQRGTGGSLLITASRRTPPEAYRALLAELGTAPRFEWSGEGENPYFGILAAAEALVVTDDSVNMTSEAAASGKPVLVFGIEGGSEKFSRFHAAMREAGLTRPFQGRLERWEQPPFAEPQRVARLIRERLPLLAGR